MKKAIAIVALGLSLTSAAAMAAERTTDAALGAASGAVVLGPIGAVAGALVGYTAGPSIAHSWGLRRSSETRHGGRSVRSSGNAASNQEASTPRVGTAGPLAGVSASPAKPSTQSAGAPNAMPPVQALE